MSDSAWVNRTALTRMGWTDAMVRELLGKPDQVGPWRSNRWPEHRYATERVRAAMDGEAFRAAAARRAQRAELRSTAPERRSQALTSKYGDWRGALADACAGMYRLNRLAKATWPWREEIYGLKDRFIELLYREGLCAACWVHVLTRPAKVCWDCGGEGCDRCDYSGDYLPERKLRFVCFRFEVARRTYVWHAPELQVKFAFKTTEPEQPWAGLVEVDFAAGMQPRHRTAAMQLVRWVVEGAASQAGRAAA